MLGAYSLDIVERHNVSRGLYLYFAFHAVHVAMNAPLETVQRFPHTSEKDAKLAQKLGQLQPFIAVFPQECMGQLASFGPT